MLGSPHRPKALSIIGGTLHFIHFCIRVSQIRSIPESDVSWEDMYRKDNNVAWFDWVRSSPIYFKERTNLFFFSKNKKDCAYDMSLDPASLNTIFLFTDTMLIPPLPPARPHRIPTRAFRLCANKSSCTRDSPAHVLSHHI
jgi:hypothetical protein